MLLGVNSVRQIDITPHVFVCDIKMDFDSWIKMGRRSFEQKTYRFASGVEFVFVNELVCTKIFLAQMVKASGFSCYHRGRLLFDHWGC